MVTCISAPGPGPTLLYGTHELFPASHKVSKVTSNLPVSPSPGIKVSSWSYHWKVAVGLPASSTTHTNVPGWVISTLTEGGVARADPGVSGKTNDIHCT